MAKQTNKTIQGVKSAAKDAAAKGSQALANKKPKTIKGYLNQMYPAIKKAVPGIISPERFTRVVMTAISNNPELENCTPQSFCGAMMQAAQLGLEPNTVTGEAYLIPFRNHGKTECQFQLGYKGLIELARRSGEIISIEARTVYENDAFDYEYGWEPHLRHKPALTNRGEPIAFYALYKTRDGGGSFEVMSIEDVKEHAERYSQSYRNGRMSPWQTDFKAMSKKTVLKQLLKYAPMSVELVKRVAADETIKSVDFEDAEVVDSVDILDQPNEVDFTVVPEAAEAEPGNAPEAPPELAGADEPFPA